MSSSKVQPAPEGNNSIARRIFLSHTASSIRKSFTENINKFRNLANLALIAGATMSFSDLGFDLVMIIEYMQYNTSAAYATIGTIAISLFVQCCVVYAFHKNRQKRYVLRELFYVISCIKPGVDAYRVVTKQPLPQGVLVSSHEEMMFL